MSGGRLSSRRVVQKAGHSEKPAGRSGLDAQRGTRASPATIRSKSGQASKASGRTKNAASSARELVRKSKAKHVAPARTAATSSGARRNPSHAPAEKTKSVAQIPPKSKVASAKVKQRGEQERLKKALLKERESAAKSRAKEKLQREKTREAAQKAKEQERLRKQREQEATRAAKAKDAERRQREEAKQKLLQERETKRLAVLAAREEERQRAAHERESARREKEELRQREKAEKEAERELARRQKEEERAKRDAEREAYRKAKETERERIRATKEAQKRALEGRIAEATRNANKLGGGRSSTTRIYSPRAIPNQSGTTRRVLDAATHAAQSNVVYAEAPPVIPEVIETDPGVGVPGIGVPLDETPRLSPPPERPLPTAESVEERYRVIEERLKEAPAEFRNNYLEAIDMSWIYHDSALEGVVYTFQELHAAIDNDPSAITDSSLQPVIEEVRRHKSAIDLVRELGEKKRAPITVDVIKKIYLTLHPEEGDLKTVKYRRDIPQHRLYFHEYSHPEKIQLKIRQIVDWLNGPEPKKLKSPIRVASRAHYELLRVFPFQTDSGKVARLFMNLLLLRAGHPPAIVHSTERQRYYESLRGSLPALIQMVTESILSALISIEKLLDEHDTKAKA